MDYSIDMNFIYPNDNLEALHLKYEGESNINGNFAVDCTKHVRT